jgi:threonine/homoserine/homoserine lactone efflux protein
MELSIFLSVVLIHLLAAMSPGPSFVVCLRTAASEGFGTAVALSFGFGAGAALWAAGAMAGLALLFELVPVVFVGLKIVGGLFLLYVAYMMWRHAPTPMVDSSDTAPRSAWSAFRFGFLTFATNPKPAVFYGAVFVGLVPTDATWPARIALLLAIFANETLWYITVSRVFSFPKARAAYARAKTWVDRIFGAMIAAFGLKIALT